MPKINAKPAGNYMLKVNNGNTRTRCGISSNLTIKTPDLVPLLLTLTAASWELPFSNNFRNIL